MRSTLCATGFVFLAAFIAGCGGPTVCEVSGTISYDGQPIKQGGITFTPTDGKSPTAGAVIKDGRYDCKLSPGEHKVVVNGTKDIDRKPIDITESGTPVSNELLPAKYNQSTELKYEAQTGKHEKNWDLAK
jgi:hypothetical protein